MTVEIHPLHYILHLEPDLDTLTFSGVAAIQMQAASAVQEVILQGRELALLHCTLAGSETGCPFELNPGRQEVRIQLPQPVQGTFTLRIAYSGTINDRYAGFYRSRYTLNGQEKVMASTQFEAKDARRAFPCFDQPGEKASFDIEIAIPAGLTAIANTAVVSEQPLEGGKKLVRFARTPKMSTYLVFFAVGEFEFLEDASEAPLVRVAVTPGKREFGRFALDMARKSLRFGAQYTGIPFPMTKCDYIAVPDSIGAMENFGAIRHAEDDLLVYPGKTSRARAALTAKIIAHEGIHMWFGDLVSPAAWKYLWLNEAFATYFTYIIPHHFFPEWGVWEQFFQERLLSGMERDSLAGTVPIDLPNVDDPDADPAPTPSTGPIVYNKGASILRMLEAYLGEQRFKQAVHDFLVQFQFEAATSGQFWEAVSRSTGVPLNQFAETWIHQAGYPLVSVERDGNALRLAQTRFAYTPDQTPQQTWVIPVNGLCFLGDGSTQTFQVLLDQPFQTFQLPEGITTCKLNVNFTGFYRTRYTLEELDRLGGLVRQQKLSAADSLNILNDFFALVKAGIYPVEDYLRFVGSCLTNENRYLPLMDLAKNLTSLFLLIPTKRSEISRLGTGIFEQALAAIGYLPSADEALLTSELRTSMLAAAFLLGSQAASEFGQAQFQMVVDGHVVHSDLLPAVLKIGAAAHPQAEEWLTARAVNSTLPEGERIRMLEALGKLGEPQALRRALQVNMEKISPGLRQHMIVEAATNPSALEWIWDWYADNLPQMEGALPRSHVENITVRLAPLAGIGRRRDVAACLQALAGRSPDSADSIRMALEMLSVNEKIC